MKRKLPLIFGALFLAFAATACEGPQGPKGDTGDVGPTGPQGPAGQDGQNALNTCSDCHTSDAMIVAIEQQFATTKHADNYLRASGECINCHTSQGFVANVTGGTADFTNGAAKINCRTCHQIHSTYEGADFALTTSDPVTLMLTGTEIDVGEGNLCANCHQARTEDVYPAWDAAVSATFDIPSTHYSLHHGPQANVYRGEFPAELLYGLNQGMKFNAHQAPNCVGCHMGMGAAVDTFDLPTPTPGGTLGHNYAPDDALCDACHGAADGDFDHGGVRTDVMAVLDGLKGCLEAEGVVTVDATTGAWDPIVGTHPEPYVAAFLVFAALEEDSSMGAHNPGFITGWLDEVATTMDTNSTNAACDYTSPF